ncbi:MAG: hemolysin family protein [Patescibacteria group bacterium]
MEILIVLLLIVLNGVFAMAEIAIISVRKQRLQQKANEGNKNAKAALELANNPSRFLSTVQVGITLVGIFAGAYGGATIAESLSKQISTIPLLDPYSDILGLIVVVGVITYLSLIIGELVPKRIALGNPEGIALLVSRPMSVISFLVTPIVKLLSKSTDWVLRLLQIKSKEEVPVSEEEIRMLIREGARAGVFGITEKNIVERTFSLNDRKVNSLMTTRKDITWIDIDSSFKTIRSKIAKNPHSRYPVCRDTLDKVIGIVRTEDLFTNFLVEEKIDLKKTLHKPLFVPTNMAVLKVLELFKKSGLHTALIVDEYGNVEGLLSLADILEAIVGDIPTVDDLEEQKIVKRNENSWFIDGLLSVDEFKEYFHIRKLPGEKTGAFHTTGGFVMHKVGHIPSSGDSFEWENYRFEVVDMDGHRVDKILLSLLN